MSLHELVIFFVKRMFLIDSGFLKYYNLVWKVG